jgi:hypothetical protein
MVAIPVIPVMAESIKLDDWDPGQTRQKVRFYLQNNQNKRAGGMVQEVESLPHKCEVVSSNPNIAKKRV